MPHVVVFQVSPSNYHDPGKREDGRWIEPAGRLRLPSFYHSFQKRYTYICFKYRDQNKNKVLILNILLFHGLGNNRCSKRFRERS